jgi:hypothetical protein
LLGHAIAADEKQNKNRQQHPSRPSVDFYQPPLKVIVHCFDLIIVIILTKNRVLGDGMSDFLKFQNLINLAMAENIEFGQEKCPSHKKIMMGLFGS